MKIKAAVVHEKGGEFCIEDVDLVEPSHDEILVKIVASGICHTDEFARSGEIPITFPVVLGHEGAGIVESIGSNVKDFEKGDHVVFSYAYCNHCDSCYLGRPYSCERFSEINFMGKNENVRTTLYRNEKQVSLFFGQSSFATHSVINQAFAVKVDNNVDLSLLSSLGCGVQTGVGTVLNTLKPRIGESVAVFGCGGVGLSAIMGAKIARCKTIIAVGGNEKSLSLAKKLGATHTINRKEIDNVSSTISNITKGGVSYAIDTSGYGPLIKEAINSTCFYGKIIALAPSGILENLNVGSDILMNMRTLQSVCEGEAVPKIFIPELVQYFKNGELPLEKITKKYHFNNIDEAFKDSLSGKVIKAVITM